MLSIKQIDAGVLNVGYAENGPGEGPAVLLLHGVTVTNRGKRPWGVHRRLEPQVGRSSHARDPIPIGRRLDNE